VPKDEDIPHSKATVAKFWYMCSENMAVVTGQVTTKGNKHNNLLLLPFQIAQVKMFTAINRHDSNHKKLSG
jgi:hypothetical protein